MIIIDVLIIFLIYSIIHYNIETETVYHSYGFTIHDNAISNSNGSRNSSSRSSTLVRQISVSKYKIYIIILYSLEVTQKLHKECQHIFYSMNKTVKIISMSTS